MNKLCAACFLVAVGFGLAEQVRWAFCLAFARVSIFGYPRVKPTRVVDDDVVSGNWQILRPGRLVSVMAAHHSLWVNPTLWPELSRRLPCGACSRTLPDPPKSGVGLLTNPNCRGRRNL